VGENHEDGLALWNLPELAILNRQEHRSRAAIQGVVVEGWQVRVELKEVLATVEARSDASGGAAAVKIADVEIGYQQHFHIAIRFRLNAVPAEFEVARTENG